MKSYGALLLYIVQAVLLQVPTGADVACSYNERKDSCNLCSYYILDGEVMQDLTLCGGDCQLESHGNSQICRPKAVNCGHKRHSDCGICPIVSGASHIRLNMSLCQEDCEVKSIRSNQYCVLKEITSTEATTTMNSELIPSQAASTSRPSNELIPADSNYPYLPSSSRLTENAVLILSSSTLTEITVNIVNGNQQSRPNKIGFKAEVCIEHNCCQTGVLFKRAGLFKFSQVFQNLGECTHFTRDAQKEVQVRAVKTDRERTTLQVLSITAQLDDGSLFTAEDVRTWFGRQQHYYLSWNRLRGTQETSVEVSNNLPEPHCPDIHTININVCPKANIRVHERISDKRKFCYYQECDTFSADLSSIETEQLGTGGYCVSKRDLYPQYKYCCDLEQYFTTPERQERTEVKFPRCMSMNNTRNDI